LVSQRGLQFKNQAQKKVKHMAKNAKSFEIKCQLGGWLLFIASALFYGIASIRSGDLLGFLGSLFFLVACFVFLIPFVFHRSSE